jgi:hypothetical protein
VTGFDTTPEPRFLRGLQNQKWTAAGALAELVDNSYGSGRGNADRVTISYDTKTRILSVLDDGQGMRAVGELFRLGATAGRTPGDIGEYGQGGTLALLWLFQEVTVWTLRDGRYSTVRMKWEDVFKMSAFPIVPDEWRRATPAIVPVELYELSRGTLISGRLSKTRTLQVSNVRRDLAGKFAPATRYGKELVWKASPTDEQYLNNPLPAFATGKAFAIELVLRTPDGHDLGVRGQIGEVPNLPLDRSRIHVGFGPRVIMETRDFFDSVDGEDRFRVAGIAGWLDLLDGWQPYLATTKDAIHHGPVYDALREKIFFTIKPLLEQLRKARENLLLNDLTLELNSALDTGVPTHVDVAGADESESDECETPREAKNEGHGRPHDSGEGEGRKEELPRVAMLELAQFTDEEMGQRLCSVERQNDGIAVFLNGDHFAVRKALEREPINKLALALLVLGEVSRLLAEDSALARKVLPRRQFHSISAIENPDHKAGIIHRILIDRVHGIAA